MLQHLRILTTRTNHTNMIRTKTVLSDSWMVSPPFFLGQLEHESFQVSMVWVKRKRAPRTSGEQVTMCHFIIHQNNFWKHDHDHSMVTTSTSNCPMKAAMPFAAPHPIHLATARDPTCSRQPTAWSHPLEPQDGALEKPSMESESQDFNEVFHCVVHPLVN